MNKLSVLWLASWYPNRTSINNGDFVQRQAIAVSQYYQVIVVTLAESKTVEAVQLEVINRTDTDLIELIFYYPYKKYFNLGFKVKYYLECCQKVKQFFKNEQINPQLIHLHVIYPIGLLALCLKRFWKIPMFISEHSTMYMKEKKQGMFFKKLANRSIAVAEKVIVVSEQLKKRMEKNGIKASYSIVPNIIDIHLFKHDRAKKQKEPFEFIHISNLSTENKNTQGIIKAIARLDKKKYWIHLTIVGAGKEKKSLEDLVEHLALQKYITFMGELSHDEVANALKKADALLMFSNIETYSVVNVEAWASGIPIIATPTGIVIENWAADNNCILVPFREENALIEAMSTMIEEYEKFDLTATQQRIQAECSSEAVAKKIKAIYQEKLI